MLTSTLTFNRSSCPSTLIANLLAIVARLFYCDCNIFNLVIGFSIDVPINVVGGIYDDIVVSSYVGLGIRLGERLGEDYKINRLYFP
jgi:hypothetical protein